MAPYRVWGGAWDGGDLRTLVFVDYGEKSGDAAAMPRFFGPVRRDAEMWRPTWRYLHENGGDVVDEARFEAMFA